jgi:hypothetical protein
MKKLNFKQWYAIVFLIVFIVYGWLYLSENRYSRLDGGYFLDTWTFTVKQPFQGGQVPRG